MFTLGTLLESILFVILTFVTYYGDQTIPRGGVCLVFDFLGEVISEQSIVMSFFVVFELVLGR